MEDSTPKMTTEGSVVNFVEVKNARMKLLDVLSNVFRNGFRFPPNFDQVWGTERENDLRSYF